MQQHPYQPEDKLVGEVLRQLRIERGLKQVDVANRLGAYQSYVSRYESGEIPLRFTQVRQICQTVFKLPMASFVERYEQELSAAEEQ